MSAGALRPGAALTAALLFAGPSGAGGGPLSPHPADEGFCEAEYVPARGVLEVALRLDGLTLDRALTSFTGREVRLDDPGGDAAAASYLVRALRLQHRRACGARAGWTPCDQRFVGYEFEGPDAWLYLEVLVPAEPAELRGSFEAGFDLFPTQLNLLETACPRGRGLHAFAWGSGWADLTYLLRPPGG